MGRRKIIVEKIEDSHARQICFSKRRKGLFGKATELCNKGGGEVAIVIFSSAGNLYCYGWPGVDAVVRRYFRHQFASDAAADGSGGDGGVGLRREGDGGAWWWDVPVEGMELQELEVMHDMLGELREKAAERAARLLGDKPAEASGEARSCVSGPSGSSEPAEEAPSPEAEFSLELSLKFPY